ncbi:Uncharacterized protein APZ42_013760 [Daphnia magna]|uniref:Integrase catalytic domain-containing protein n=1 Tax=Daphnia magna TaxID=35525 RepID=A0A162QIA9_9CRUS|nr:Uncharacterized protein APZ42_013760 [Daphnia magna]
MKQTLVSAATLAYPHFTRPFEIHLDACDYGLGTVLLQRVNIIERSLAYASRLLSPSESNYSITEKERLALVWAVKKFRSFVWGMDTLVVTDHHALCWLLTKKDISGRLTCWSLQLQEFLLRIIHRNGRLHTDADAFSRYPVDAPQELDEQLHCTLGAFSVDTESKSEFQQAQQVEWDQVFAGLEKGRKYSQYRLKDVRDRYYWWALAEDVRYFVRACRECHSRKPVYQRPAGFMEIQRNERPFERLGMDILGPFPLSKSGNKSIVVAVYYVTKWEETRALPSADASEVADFLVKCVLLRHGAPPQLTTDQKRCFTAKVTQKVLQALKTNHRTTTAYRSQANGLVERLNHTLADMLSMYVSSDHKDWDESLPFVTFAYNTSRHESKGRTPFYLVYGREAVFPIDGALNADPNLIPPPDRDPSEWAVERLQQARLEVQARTAAVQQKQKKVYDEGRREATTYLPVEEVLIYKPIIKLRLGRTVKIEIVHVERMKPFVDCVSIPTPEQEAAVGSSLGVRGPELRGVNRNSPADPPAARDGPPHATAIAPEGVGLRRSTRIRVPRKTFLLAFPLIFLLAAISGLGPVAASEIVAYQRVIFKLEGELAFSDSEWVVVTDFTFDLVDQVIKSLYEWLDIRINAMSDHYDGPKSQFKSRAQEEFLKYQKIHQRWNKLKTAVGVQESRVKRGLVDGRGRLLNWLFGVSTQEDLEHVNDRINKLSTETTSIVHALEVHGTYINETRWETKASGDAVAELQADFARIEREACKIYKNWTS